MTQPPLSVPRRWAGLAVLSLALAGLLALLIALARMPGAEEVLPFAREGFFRKALVTHVDLSVLAWVLCILASLTSLAPGRSGAADRAGLALAALGILLLCLPALLGLGEPSLNNYVPVLDHDLFLGALAILALGTAAAVPRAALKLRGGFSHGAAAAGLTYLLALVCVGLAWAYRPEGAGGEALYEWLFWGGGHVLQFTVTLVMLTLWSLLLESASGRPPLPPVLAIALFWWLALAALAGPLLYPLLGGEEGATLVAFSDLYVYGLAPPAGLFVLGTAWALWRERRRLSLRDTGTLAVLLSLGLFAMGGVMGFFVGLADTRTPAHYHAVLGGANLAMFAYILVVLAPRAAEIRGRAERVALWLYGIGQGGHSVGLFIAGGYGAARKSIGDAQGIEGAAAIAAMAVMGVGAVLAVAGGAAFVFIAARRLWGGTAGPIAATGELSRR